MNITKFFWVLGFMLVTQQAWGYGSGSSSSGRNICDKTDFTEFAPADKSKAAPGSEFSFQASKKINPDRIKVTVKDLPVDVTVTPDRLGYRVKGKLPESLKGAFARISIKAEGVDKCQGSAGWLVDIGE